MNLKRFIISILGNSYDVTIKESSRFNLFAYSLPGIASSSPYHGYLLSNPSDCHLVLLPKKEHNDKKLLIFNFQFSTILCFPRENNLFFCPSVQKNSAHIFHLSHRETLSLAVKHTFHAIKNLNKFRNSLILTTFAQIELKKRLFFTIYPIEY